MSVSAPGITGPIDVDLDGASTLAFWLSDRTGSRGFVLEALAGIWGLQERIVEDEAAPTGLQAQAQLLAAARPYVVLDVPIRPEITGNLAEDVHRVSGLTWKEIAGLYGITERAVAGWRKQGVPTHRAGLMEALRAIGAMLVGGLGRKGVRSWLSAGNPSRLGRLRDGELESVLKEALSYADDPAT